MLQDATPQINALTAEIRTDIQGLNAQLDRIQVEWYGVCFSQRSSQRQTFSQQKDRQTVQPRMHNNNVVSSLKNHLLTTTKAFKDVLQTRSDSLKTQADRQAPFGRSRDLGKPLVYKAAAAATPTHSNQSSSGVGSGSMVPFRNPALVSPSHAAAFQQVSEQVFQTPEQSYLQSRASDVQQIESHIVEMGQIFNRLGQMVAEQGDMITRYELSRVGQRFKALTVGVV